MGNAKNMDVLFHATAPRKTLFGVHSKFYSFTDGCSEPDGDCTPEERGTTNSTPSTTSTKPSTSPTSSATPSPTSSTTSHPETSETTQANNDDSAAPHATLSLLLLSASILVAKCRF